MRPWKKAICSCVRPARAPAIVGDGSWPLAVAATAAVTPAMVGGAAAAPARVQQGDRRLHKHCKLSFRWAVIGSQYIYHDRSIVTVTLAGLKAERSGVHWQSFQLSGSTARGGTGWPSNEDLTVLAIHHHSLIAACTHLPSKATNC
jgi:hypothetical protein